MIKENDKQNFDILPKERIFFDITMWLENQTKLLKKEKNINFLKYLFIHGAAGSNS